MLLVHGLGQPRDGTQGVRLLLTIVPIREQAKVNDAASVILQLLLLLYLMLHGPRQELLLTLVTYSCDGQIPNQVSLHLCAQMLISISQVVHLTSWCTMLALSSYRTIHWPSTFKAHYIRVTTVNLKMIHNLLRKIVAILSIILHELTILIIL